MKTKFKNPYVFSKPPGLIKPTYMDIKKTASMNAPAIPIIIAPLDQPNFSRNFRKLKMVEKYKHQRQ